MRFLKRKFYVKYAYFCDFELSLGRTLCLVIEVHMRNTLFHSKQTKLRPDLYSITTRVSRGFFMLSIIGFVVTASTNQLHAQDGVSLIQQEVNRRVKNVTKAQEFLKQGDVAYNAGEFKKAVGSYRNAFELIPEAGMTHQLRFAAGDRYAQAAVEYGKVLARTGQYDTARKHLNDVLKEDVAPGNAGAMKMLAKLDDPIRYSPTLTPEHVRNIEKVAHWLRKGESYFLQAQYDEALVAYEEVLRIDNTNKAARRGMERVVQNIRNYNASARDHARSEALNQVEALWELKVKPKDKIFVVGGDDSLNIGNSSQDIRGNKLKQIIVPSVEMDDISFNEAIRMVRIWARELDTTELDPDKKGINFVTRIGDEKSGFKQKIEGSRINLQLKNTPLSVVLDYVTQQSGTYWRQEQFAVVIRPRGTNTTELETRSFRVPPSFMDDADATETEDVFGNAPTLQNKIGVVDFLKKLGIAFPDGATAFYNRTNGTLRVTNAPPELDAIEAYVRAQALGESVMVVVKTSILEVSERTLNELGYDWLLEPARLKNNVFVTGGTQGNGTAVNAAPSNIGATIVAGNSITSGNRSGDGMFQNNTIDSRIAGISTPSTNRAPSPLSVTSQINDATFQTIMRALNQKTGEAKLHQSSTVSIAGQRVELASGNQIIYPTEYEPGELSQEGFPPNNPPTPLTVDAGGGIPATPSQPTAFESRQLGYSLTVEPTVSDDKNYIDLQLNPSVVTFEGFIDYGNPLNTSVFDPITGLPTELEVVQNRILMPVFRTIRLNTGVTVQDGATVVVGGLIQQRIENVKDKVPMLGDLPLVGRFFQSQGLQNTRTAIIMFVKVELVDPTGQAWRER